MLKSNWINLSKEIEEIKLLNDDAEKAIRLQLIDSVIETINEYNGHLSEYEYARKRQEVINRGVIFVPQSKPSSIKANWSKLFASSISSEKKREIGYEYFRWHIFSYELINALSKSKAKQAFNKCKKEKVYIFYQHNDEVYAVENAQLLKSIDFDLDYDIYIFDTVQKWTYVHTHESQCGPYFYQIK